MNPCDRCTPAFYRYLDIPVEDQSDLLTIFSGIQQPLFNGVFGTASGEAASLEAIRGVAKVLKGREAAHSWWLREDQAPDGFESAMEELGYNRLGRFPGMVCAATEAKLVEAPEELNIKRISRLDGFAVWADLVCDVFEIGGDARISYKQLLEGHLDGNFACLAGYRDDQIVSTASILLDGPEGYIFNICTDEGARRKGYGKALTSAAMHLGIDAGCKTLALISSPVAESVYTKLGFESRYQYSIHA